jgi:hypothetical protein
VVPALPSITVTAPGRITGRGVTATGEDGGPVPAAFRAVTVQFTVAPLVNPFTTIERSFSVTDSVPHVAV